MREALACVTALRVIKEAVRSVGIPHWKGDGKQGAWHTQIRKKFNIQAAFNGCDTG
jgi:predicted transposase YbfD/YdcC